MMTTEKAIQLLQRISDSQFDGIHGDERREALEMAVRALSSQQTDTDSQGLVNDCISRQAAIIVFENSGLDDDSKDTVVRVLEQLPPAQPRKKGKWIDNDKINFPQCSECGMWIDVMQQSGEMNFCPNCGADMRGGANVDAES